jgi:uncharacterized membrane protein
LAWPIIVAWIHYVSIMLMIASLLGEHLLLKQELTVAQAKVLPRYWRKVPYRSSAQGMISMFGLR